MSERVGRGLRSNALFVLSLVLVLDRSLRNRISSLDESSQHRYDPFKEGHLGTPPVCSANDQCPCLSRPHMSASIIGRAEQDAGALRLISRCALAHGFRPML
jgi:hypothetical protein